MELDDLNVEQLQELARKNELSYSGLDKDELVEYLDSEGIEADDLASDAGAAPARPMSSSSDAPVAQRGGDSDVELSELDVVTRRYVEPRPASSPNPGEHYPE